MNSLLEKGCVCRALTASAAGCALALTLGSATAETVPLDLSGGFNHDGYITWAEATHAALYNPPSSWGLGTRMVNTVFGEHSTGASGGGRNLCWADQGSDGLAANGILTTTYGSFQLSTERDAEPAGGYVLGPVGSPPVLPVSHNVVRVQRPHSGSTAWPSATTTVMLPVSQWSQYDSVNFLVAGNNTKALIYAEYDDGAGGLDQQLIYESPGTPKTASERGFPDIQNSTSANPDIISAQTMTQLWAQSSNYSDIRAGTANIWTFADPLALDPSKTLVGFTFAVYNADTWKARQAVVFAAVANTTRPAIYVDAVNGSNTTGDGSSASPFQTIGHVVPLLAGGEDVILRNGSYGNVTINKSGNLFPDWVVFKAAAGATPEVGRFILAGPGGPANQTGGFDAYVRLENIILRDGWKADGARHWALVNCYIERIGPYTGNGTNMAKTAVEFRNGTDVTIEACEITNTAVGIAGRAHQVTVRGCHIHGGSHDGIQVTGWWDSVVEDNIIHSFDDGVTDGEASWSKHCDLIHIFIPGPGNPGMENNNVVFRYNTLYDTESQGVQFNNYYASSLRNKDITFEYNVFGPTKANIFNNADPTDGLIFRHNTVVHLSSPRTFGRWTMSNYTVRIGPSTGVEIYNNNLVTIGMDSNTQVDLFDWNLLRNTPNPTPAGVDASRAFGRFTQVGVDCLLAAPADDFDGALQAGSPAINAGTLVFAPTTLPDQDLQGTPIDIRPDLGAWEMPGNSPAAEPVPSIVNDTKTVFVDDFEDGHYNDVDDWLNGPGQQGLSWYRPAISPYKYAVRMTTALGSRNGLNGPSGTSGVQRIAWLLSEQGSDWADYDLTFRAHNAYQPSGVGPLLLVQDQSNCYWLDIGRDSGRLVRIMGGVSTVLATSAAIELPHSGVRSYAVTVRHVGGGIQIQVDADQNGSVEFSYTDTDAVAQSVFTTGGIGVHDNILNVNNRVTFDDFEVNVVSFGP